MHISMRDLVPDHLEFEHAARRRTALEWRSLWRARYAERHPEVFECYLRVSGDPRDIAKLPIADLVRLGPAEAPELASTALAADDPAFAP